MFALKNDRRPSGGGYSGNNGVRCTVCHIASDVYQAVAAGVPFPDAMPIDFGGTGVAILGDLTVYYQALTVNTKDIPKEMEQSSRRKYAYFPVNNDRLWGQNYNLPERNGRRRGSVM